MDHTDGGETTAIYMQTISPKSCVTEQPAHPGVSDDLKLKFLCTFFVDLLGKSISYHEYITNFFVNKYFKPFLLIILKLMLYISTINI